MLDAGREAGHASPYRLRRSRHGTCQKGGPKGLSCPRNCIQSACDGGGGNGSRRRGLASDPLSLFQIRSEQAQERMPPDEFDRVVRPKISRPPEQPLDDCPRIRRPMVNGGQCNGISWPPIAAFIALNRVRVSHGSGLALPDGSRLPRSRNRSQPSSHTNRTCSRNKTQAPKPTAGQKNLDAHELTTSGQLNRACRHRFDAA